MGKQEQTKYWEFERDYVKGSLEKFFNKPIEVELLDEEPDWQGCLLKVGFEGTIDEAFQDDLNTGDVSYTFKKHTGYYIIEVCE